MKKRKRWPIVLALWGIFIFLVAAVAYLSFQNGEDARILGKQMMTQVAQIQHQDQNMTQVQMDELIYQLRQSGRVLIFVLIGMVGTLTIHVTFSRSSWLLQTSLTAVILVGIAYFTEKLNIYIPSRHYSYEEMMISIASVIVGFVLVSVITLVYRAIKNILKFLIYHTPIQKS